MLDYGALEEARKVIELLETIHEGFEYSKVKLESMEIESALKMHGDICDGLNGIQKMIRIKALFGEDKLVHDKIEQVLRRLNKLNNDLYTTVDFRTILKSFQTLNEEFLCVREIIFGYCACRVFN